MPGTFFSIDKEDLKPRDFDTGYQIGGEIRSDYSELRDYSARFYSESSRGGLYSHE